MGTEANQNEPSGELFDSLPLPENFEAVAAKTAAAKAVPLARARVIMPNRDQIELRPTDLESLLPQGHRARLVWAWVERQDLSAMYAAIKVREGGVGRSAIAPQILLALWLYATLQGVGSARQLSRLVLEHDAYRWISGGVQVNHHSLSDFRVAHGAALDADADASVMKMADGGFRPAYNTQFASDCDAQVIVGVEVSTSGSDMAQLAPMVSQVEQRLGQAAAQWLVDGGFPAHDQIDAVDHKTEVYAPVPQPRAKKDDEGNAIVQDKHQPKPDDSPAVAKWRQRMASDDAKEIYKLRAATAECVNAQARNRGLQRLPVRGRAKVRCVALLFALAHNLMRTLTLVPALLGLGPTASASSAGTA